MEGNGARVCIATVTWAHDDQERQLLRESLLALDASGLPIVVADRGSDPPFRDVLRAQPRLILAAPRHPSLVGQVQASVLEAAGTGADFVLYTEPDKALFFTSGLPEFLARADLHSRAGAVLAARSDASFSTFPPFQQFTERTINELCARFLGRPGDYSYGPFLLNRDLVPRVAAIAPHAGWGWRHFMFASAHRAGYQVDHVVGDYPCPPDQRAEHESDRLHRARQLHQNVGGLVAGMEMSESKG
ncbi:MAG: hypothetical protein V7647_809 [Acidobacteriota bacterium]